jgi:osmotically-inducible protein OsmY
MGAIPKARSEERRTKMSQAASNQKSDRELEVEILRELEWDPKVDASEVRAEVKMGVVTLTGEVDSYAEKVAALEAA